MTIIVYIEQDGPEVPALERCEAWQIHLSRGLTDSEWEEFIKIIGRPDAERGWEGTGGLSFGCWQAGYYEEYHNYAFDRAWIDSREEYNEQLKTWLESLS
jgi:hypothetical protein